MGDGWPAWATQKVVLAEPDPAWPQRAADLCLDLDQRLEAWLAGDVEHVGSTAVPGLPAKPIIDLMAPVRSLEQSEAADHVLADAGWHLVPPDLDRRPWRRMYVLPDGDRRVAHLHLVEPRHPEWDRALRFRDLLREDPRLATEYAQLKRDAARAHPDDREAYTEAKSAFVEAVLRPGG